MPWLWCITSVIRQCLVREYMCLLSWLLDVGWLAGGVLLAVFWWLQQWCFCSRQQGTELSCHQRFLAANRHA